MDNVDESVEADAARFRWMVGEPEGARHLLSLLQREGSSKAGSFRSMIDRISTSQRNAASRS